MISFDGMFKWWSVLGARGRLCLRIHKVCGDFRKSSGGGWQKSLHKGWFWESPHLGASLLEWCLLELQVFDIFTNLQKMESIYLPVPGAGCSWQLYPRADFWAIASHEERSRTRGDRASWPWHGQDMSGSRAGGFQVCHYKCPGWLINIGNCTYNDR